MNLSRKARGGFSLVELMVAMAAGLVVSGAVLAYMLSGFKANADYVQSTKLTQELRNTLDLVTRELRRAGYDESAVGRVATGQASQFARLRLESQVAAGPPITYSCVIYAYDRSGGVGGGNPEVSNGEVRGLRRAVATVNGRQVGVIEYAESTGTLKPACNGASPDYSAFPIECNAASTWCPLSDPTALDITSFTLADRRTTVGTAPNAVVLRNLDVALVGRIAGSAEYSRGIKSSVRVRTDCFDPTIANCSLTP